jgi:outer membrane protein with beta-barrel domain
MRNRLAVILSAAAFVAVFAAANASAQDRAGGWLGVGGGWGSANLTSDEMDESDDTGRENSGVVYFNGGYAVNPHVLVGGELNLWTKSFDDQGLGGTADVNFYNVLGTVTVYPSAGVGGFFMKGGAGVGFFDMNAKAAGVTVNFDLGKGLAAIAGGGYDIPVGRLTITPAVNYWYGSTGDMKVLGETLLTGVSHNVITTTVGVTWP